MRKKGGMSVKKAVQRAWYFVWEEDSLASWLVNVVLAFIIIKFLVYPALGFALGTTAPIVAVVSGSMEHDSAFESFWSDATCCNYACSRSEPQGPKYEAKNISREVFSEFQFVNGFNKGDIMILYSPKNAVVGDVIVYIVPNRPYPIIHRVISIDEPTEVDGKRLFWTKGDHNCDIGEFEKGIPEEHVIGKAVWRVPFLGWVKIVAVSLLQVFIGG